MIIRFKFNNIKTIQAASYLLSRNGGSMSKGILLKMLYLTDRALLVERGHPLTGDQPVSMENGPVLSTVYDLMKGAALQHRRYWEQHISDAKKGEQNVSLKKNAGTDRLSKSELSALQKTYDAFKKFSWKQMVDYCHALPEWKNPGKSSRAIDLEIVLVSAGKEKPQIQEIQSQSFESELIDVIMSSPVTTKG
jgi:uncharacterized phage-associated protein